MNFSFSSLVRFLMTKLFPTISLVFVLAFGLKFYFGKPDAYDAGGLILFMIAVGISLFAEAAEDVDFRIRQIGSRADLALASLSHLETKMASIEKTSKDTNSTIHSMNKRIDVVESENKTGGGF